MRSLRKHCIDIKNNENIFNSDILAFTETQLLPDDADNEIRRNLQPFALFRRDHQRDKFMSLAVCIKDINISKSQNMNTSHQRMR